MIQIYDSIAEIEDLRKQLKKARKKAKRWKNKYLALRRSMGKAD